MENAERKVTFRKLKYPDYYSDIKRLTMTLRKSIYEKMVRIATEYAKRPTTFATEVLVAFLEKETPLPKEIAEELRALKKIAGQYGNLLNQIATRMNATQKRLIFEPLRAKKTIENYTKEMERVIKKLKNDISLSREKEP
jgi:hypothetical protein